MIDKMIIDKRNACIHEIGHVIMIYLLFPDDKVIQKVTASEEKCETDNDEAILNSILDSMDAKRACIINALMALSGGAFEDITIGNEDNIKSIGVGMSGDFNIIKEYNHYRQLNEPSFEDITKIMLSAEKITNHFHKRNQTLINEMATALYNDGFMSSQYIYDILPPISSDERDLVEKEIEHLMTEVCFY